MAFEFVLSLSDKLSAPAKTMSSAMQQVADQANVLKGAMAAAEAQAVKATALGDTNKLLKARGDYAEYGAALEKLKPQLEGAAEGDASMAESLEAIAGPAAMAAAAIAAVTAVAAAFVLEGGKMAIEATEAKEKMLATFSALAGGEAAGAQTLSMIRSLEREVPTSEKQLGDWATALLGAGVAQSKLQGALKATAAAEALVAGGGEKTRSVLEKLNEASIKGSKIKFSTATLAGTGVTETELMAALGMTPKQLELAKKQGTLTGEQISDALVSVLQQKGAGPLAQQANSLTAQWGRFKENVMKLFEDIDVKPFLDALSQLGHIFDSSTSSGKAMKSGITGTFNAIFAAAGKVIPYITRGLLYLIILGLKTYILLKTHWSQIMHVLKAVAIGFGVLVGAGALLVAGVVGVVGVLGVLTVAVYGAAAALVGTLAKGFMAAVEWATHAGDIAKQFIAGLVDGIKNGAGVVIDAVKGLGSSMLSSVKGVLGIHSPSAEMLKLGKFTGQGFAKGVQAANDNVGDAGAGMGASVSVGAAKGASGGGGAAAAGGSPIEITINVNVAGGGAGGASAAEMAQEIGSEVKKVMTDVIEQLALTQGVATAA